MWSRSRGSSLCCGVAILLLLWGMGTPAVAAEEGWGYDLWHELMSPYCPGRSLADCPSEAAEDLRTWIVEQEKAGTPREAVEARLFATFGDNILQAPRAEGFGVTAYVIPIALFLAGGLLVSVFLRRQARGREEPPAVPSAAIDDELERRLEDELREG